MSILAPTWTADRPPVLITVHAPSHHLHNTSLRLHSQDGRLRSEMPKALSGIEHAASQLEAACSDLQRDPFSQSGRDRLIAGSRGILQATTAMLVAFDQAQVRRTDCNADLSENT